MQGIKKDPTIICLLSSDQPQAVEIAIALQKKISCYCLIRDPERGCLFLKKNDRNHFILLDCRHLQYQQLLRWIGKKGLLSQDNFFVALYNCRKEEFDETDCLEKGFKGVFYDALPNAALVRGVKGIFSGELFYSRKVLSRQIAKQSSYEEDSFLHSVDLSRREFEVLQLLSLGTTYCGIADELGISHHTVRTHLHNVYRKIKVENRFQAMRWLRLNSACA